MGEAGLLCLPARKGIYPFLAMRNYNGSLPSIPTVENISPGGFFGQNLKNVLKPISSMISLENHKADAQREELGEDDVMIRFENQPRRNIIIRDFSKIKEAIEIALKNPFTPLDQLNITTITLVFHLTGKINYLAVFHLLKIHYFKQWELPTISPRAKKYQPPKLNTPGAIISVKYRERTRGLILKDSEFKNCVMIVINTSRGYVWIKLSEDNIHMCGAKSLEMAREGAELLLGIIQDIHNKILLLRDNLDKLPSIFSEIERTIRGNPVVIEAQPYNYLDYLISEQSERSERSERSESTSEIAPGEESSPREVRRNQEVQRDIIEFLTQSISEYTYYNDYLYYLQMVVNLAAQNNGPAGILVLQNNGSASGQVPSLVPSLVSGLVPSLIQAAPGANPESDPESDPETDLRIEIPHSVSILDTDIAMMNYNFNLGYSIDRHRLNVKLGGKNGFMTMYDNKIHSAVTVTLIYESKNRYRHMKKKTKIPKFTWMVYRGGAVTFTGPGRLMDDAYNLFRRTLLEIEREFAVYQQS